jgi:rhodanese-related sulfurtransferase
MKHLSPAELKARLDDPGSEQPLLLDVREPWEFAICHLEGARLMPMRSVAAEYRELNPERETVVICHHGVRSYHVARFLEHSGFTRVVNLTGGVDGWAREADPRMPTY